MSTVPTKSTDNGLKSWRLFLSCFIHPSTMARSVKVALVVGPILAIINHLDVFLNQGFTPSLLFKIGLTYLVPFSVSGFSSAQTMMAACLQGKESLTTHPEALSGGA